MDKAMDDGFKLTNAVRFAHVGRRLLIFPVGRRRFGQRAAGSGQGARVGGGYLV